MSYNAAADRYDDPANTFWARFGRRAVERLALYPGARVLDVCCGSGASALPAAERVGASGRVLAVDLSERLLELGREKAREQHHANLEFRAGDMLELGEPAESFDAVICVFGLVFAPDMIEAIRQLWRFVRPGGQLAITTWGPRLFEPMNTVFWMAVSEVRPDLYRAFNPWDQIADPGSLHSLLATAGVTAVEVLDEPGTHRLAEPRDWWTLVMGSGYRGTIEQLTRSERDYVCVRCVREFSVLGVTEVEANVLYAVGRKL